MRFKDESNWKGYTPMFAVNPEFAVVEKNPPSAPFAPIANPDGVTVKVALPAVKLGAVPVRVAA